MATRDTRREFAIDVVRRLQSAGHVALFAGGCVRDQLLGLRPKDYDVATSARPDEVRQLFGHGRTLPIGAAFGVISVLGPKGAGQIDVATFRQDDVYSDGRRPDAVTFSTPELDAQRRDFTINGLFFDPLTEEILDYVGGQDDLAARRIRAIGNPAQRIAEDRLRMLRAVRFAALFDCHIEPATAEAIRQSASLIVSVSGERIANEMRLMLGSSTRHVAFAGLRDTTLLHVLLPERMEGPEGSASRLDQIAAALKRLSSDRFETALAIIAHDLPQPVDVLRKVSARWRLSAEEAGRVAWVADNIELVQAADRRPWPTVQRVLIHQWIDDLLAAAEALAQDAQDHRGTAFCRQRLAWPTERLNPAPLIDGDDLLELQIPAGPLYRRILDAIRDRQLLGELTDKSAALALARSMAK
jgi:poly(A) polymerase